MLVVGYGYEDHTCFYFPTFTRFREMLNLQRFKIRRKALVSEALAKSTQCLCEDD